MNVAVIVLCSVEQDEVQLPEMVEPQKVLVMLPREPQNRPVVAPKATHSAGVMPSQAPGKKCSDTKIQPKYCCLMLPFTVIVLPIKY